MPCNGNNHLPDCNCGWGGINHVFFGENLYGLDYWSRERSHTNPNAICPACGSAVFFYRSPNNGKVFFDHLGPPWPKHPCTDTEERKAETKLFHTPKLREGWIPFLCDIIFSQPEAGTAIADTQGRVLYTQRKASSFDKNAPIWIRRTDKSCGEYEISTLKTRQGRTSEIRSKGYRSIEQLHKLLGIDTGRSSRRPSLSDVKSADELYKPQVGVLASNQSLMERTLFRRRKSTLHLKPKLHKVSCKNQEVLPIDQINCQLPEVEVQAGVKVEIEAKEFEEERGKVALVLMKPQVKTSSELRKKRQTQKLSRQSARVYEKTPSLTPDRQRNEQAPNSMQLAFSRAADTPSGFAGLLKIFDN